MKNEKILRVWDEARTSHFEILKKMRPGILLYRKEGYDFHKDSVPSSTAFRMGVFKTAREIFRSDVEYIQFNEPTMVLIWPQLLLYSIAVQARRKLRRKPVIVGIYAIDNADVVQVFQDLFRIPRGIAAFVCKVVISLLLRPVDRISFGTKGAHDAYMHAARKTLTSKDIAIQPQVPELCGCGPLEKTPNTVLFLAAFEERKGICNLLDAWDLVVLKQPSLRLVLVGKGELYKTVREWAAARDSVSLLHDPPRLEIHHQLCRAQLVVLLSQPHRRWREQVGLSIVEGLAHGCEVLATTETGIGEWLAEAGHTIVEPGVDRSTLADLIVGVSSTPRAPQEIIDVLPKRQTRVISDEWLTRSHI